MFKELNLMYRCNGRVAVIVLKSTVLSADLTREYNLALDEILATDGPRCLVTISDNPKIFSAGLHFSLFSKHKDEVINHVAECLRLLSRLLTLPIPSVAAVNGHCLAGGLLLMISHDIRLIQRSKDIKMAMTEIKFGMSIPEGAVAPLKAKLRADIVMRLCLHGEVADANKALKWGIADELVDNVLESAIKVADSLADLGANRVAYEGIRHAMWSETIEKMQRPKVDTYAMRILDEGRIRMMPKL